jgi:hypothetical protein
MASADPPSAKVMRTIHIAWLRKVHIVKIITHFKFQTPQPAVSYHSNGAAWLEAARSTSVQRKHDTEEGCTDAGIAASSK